LLQILENLDQRDAHIVESLHQFLSALSLSIKSNLYDNGLMSSVCRSICDAIAERRLADALCAARDALISIVTVGVSPDFII
jgi:uncharacterized protein YejL (UPF0352 family)